MDYAVYLSSTLNDLREERDAVKQALSGQCIVKESYFASESELVDSCLKDVAACNLFVCVLGLRYGLVPSGGFQNPDQLSITELEYRHAGETGIPRLVFIKDESAIRFPMTDAGTREHPMERIQEFRRRAATEQRPDSFSSAAELREKVKDALNAFKERRAKGSAPSRGVIITTDASALRDGAVFKTVDEAWAPEMVVVPAGRFLMGSPASDVDAYPEEYPQHEVTFDYRFALGRCTVTFAEYDGFCETTSRALPGDEGWGRDQYPVINVSWNDAQAYLEWLRDRTDVAYRLPTEAEWEYACRAGTTTRTYRGDRISTKHANYDAAHGRTSHVGSYPANPWGLYDMIGNVWEHVEDPYHDSYEGAPADGRAWLTGDLSRRVVRGGSFSYPLKDNRAAVRCDHDVATPDRQHGFRVALTLGATGR